MTWEVGQVVAVMGGHVPESGYPRRKVVLVYANGGCRLDDGTQWTRYGRQYGDADGWGQWHIQLASKIEAREAKELAELRVRAAQSVIYAASRECTDIARLERALAVLRGEA